MREECDFGDLQREVAFLLVIPEWFHPGFSGFGSIFRMGLS